jgi:putative ABC transport system permease protein
MTSALRYAVRRLARTPSFTLSALAALALGIGGNTAVFSAVYAALLRPFPYPQAERLQMVYETVGEQLGTLSPPNFTDLRAASRSFEAMAAFYGNSAALTGEGNAEQVQLGMVTADFFRVLRVAPLVGRTFDERETAFGGPKAVVLGEALWRRRFGGDPSVVGRAMRLDGVDHLVVGVMPASAALPRGADLWMPTAFSPEVLATQRGAHYLSAIGRLRAGVSPEAASTELRGIAARLAAAYPAVNGKTGAAIRSLREATAGGVQKALFVLLGAVGLVLLVACANVANLQLARAARERRARAIRVAVGARRVHLVRDALAEGLTLSLVGGALGAFIALWGVEALGASLRSVHPALGAVRVDAPVLGLAAALAVVTGLVVGVLPALATAGATGLAGLLAQGAAPPNDARRGSRVRGTLVATEVAMAVCLLVGAGLLLRTFVKLRDVELGFDPRNVWTFQLSLPEARYDSPVKAQQFYASLLERVRALPGVRAAGATSILPFGGSNYDTDSELDGVKLVDAPDLPATEVRIVSDDYFRAAGMRLVRGRALAPTDRMGAPPVVVVSEALARKLWPGQDPIGHRVTYGTRFGLGKDHPRAGGEVVGVVADVRGQGVAEEAPAEAYIAHAQFPVGAMALAVRADDPPKLRNALVAQVAALDRDLPVYDERMFDALLADAVAQPRVYAVLMGAFAACALLLAAVGVYGVVALAVGQRTREIGVRVALGARANDVLRLVLGRGMRPVLVGAALGLVAAWGASRVVAGLLYGVATTDLLTFAAVPLVLVVVALLAALAPARRALRIPPTTALRAE